MQNIITRLFQILFFTIFMLSFSMLALTCNKIESKTIVIPNGHWKCLTCEIYQEVQISDSLYYYIDMGKGEYTGAIKPLKYELNLDTFKVINSIGQIQNKYEVLFHDKKNLILRNTNYLEVWEKYVSEIPIKELSQEKQIVFEAFFSKRKNEIQQKYKDW